MISNIGNKRPLLVLPKVNEKNEPIKRVRLGQDFHIESLKQTNVSSLRLKKFLGSGSFGVVEQCCLKSRKKMAVKKLKNTISYAEHKYGFLHEIELHSTLDHANIIKFHSTVSEAKCLAFVMEYAALGSLYDALRKEDAYIIRNYVNIARGVAEGLAYLHSKNIMHSDLKTSNIFLNQKKVPKIGDFGCAKNIESSMRLTLQGTFAILPPEVLDGGSYSKAVDIYAFAFLLWELVTKRSPFQGKHYIEIYDLVCNKEQREDLPQSTPIGYTKLIQECWAQRAEDRPLINSVLPSLTMMRI
jgi:serine/threonine protein kinase